MDSDPERDRPISDIHHGNRFDDVHIDIEAAHALRWHERGPDPNLDTRSYYATRALRRAGLWEPLVEGGIIRWWFEEFRQYWQSCLGCRPLRGVQDFHYLRGHYRENFQGVGVAEGASSKEFRRAWQKKENIYSIFGQVYKYALDPLPGSFHLCRADIDKETSVLEYGSGVGPFSYAALVFGDFTSTSFTLADIRGFRHHYGKWRFQGLDNLISVDITNPLSPPDLDGAYDIVVLNAVLEHLPNPVEVSKWIYSKMNNGAQLVFDYPRTDGEKLDTKEAVQNRSEVLGFIEENFDILHGTIDYESDMGLTLARKS